MSGQKFTLDSIYKAASAVEVAAAYDQAAEDYDAHVEDELGWRGHKVMAGVTTRHVDRNFRVLDAGAGTGLFGAELAALGFEAIDGFDIAPGMIDVARKREIYGDLQIAALGNELPWADSSFDASTACGVFLGHHAPPDGLDELIRVTRPGGHIILTLRATADPAEDGEFTTTDYRDAMLRHEIEHHWRLVELTPPECMLSGASGSLHQVHVYQVTEKQMAAEI